MAPGLRTPQRAHPPGAMAPVMPQAVVGGWHTVWTLESHTKSLCALHVRFLCTAVRCSCMLCASGEVSCNSRQGRNARICVICACLLGNQRVVGVFCCKSVQDF